MGLWIIDLYVPTVPVLGMKAEYYRQKRAQFAAEGPVMSELSDV
jgi:hypothetical protein